MVARQGMSIELGGFIFLFIGDMLTTPSWRWVPRPLQTPPYNKAENTRCAAASGLAGRAALDDQLFHRRYPDPTTFFPAADRPGADRLFPFVYIADFSGRRGSDARSHRRAGSVAYVDCYLLLHLFAHLIFAFAIRLPIFILSGVLLGIGFGLSIPTVNHLTVDLSDERARAQSGGTLCCYLLRSIFVLADAGAAWRYQQPLYRRSGGYTGLESS